MYPAEGMYKGVFVCIMQWLCDWNAVLPKILKWPTRK